MRDHQSSSSLPGLKTPVWTRKSNVPPPGMPDSERTSLADELADARVRIASDLSVWSRVRDVSARLVNNGDLEPLLAELLGVAVDVTSFNAGFIRVMSHGDIPARVIANTGGVSRMCRVSDKSVLDPQNGHLSFPDLRAIKTPQPDRLLIAAIESGFRGFHATPLMSRQGHMIGSITTLSNRPGATDERDQHVLDLLARQAADFIEWRMAGVMASQSDARLHSVLDSVPDAILTIDPRGRIWSANPATASILGYQPISIIGQSIGIILPERDREKWMSRLVKSISSDGFENFVIQRHEIRALHKDGAELEVELVVSAVEHQPIFTAVIRDLTERRATAARLRQSDRLAALGTLAAGLGHDMNNVLFPIRAHLNALSVAPVVKSQPGDTDHVTAIMDGVRYLQQLADGLHYLVNSDENSQDSGAGIRLAAWWAGTGALLSKSLPVHTEVKVAIRGDLPPVGVTASALTQAVLNLFVNAGEAIAARGADWRGHVRIAAVAAADGRSIVLSVEDNGIGMSEAVRASALDMFFTTKPRGLGSGLGLALVSRVAKQAGGSVMVESKEGTGTTISLELPFATQHRPSFSIKVAVSLADGRAAAFVQSVLISHGYESVKLDDAAEADVWLVDPRIVTPHDALVWSAKRHGRKVILFGKSHRLQRKDWRGIATGAVERAEDFEDLLVGINRACEIIHGSTDHA